MYHLIENKDAIKIVRSVKSSGLKMPILLNYLKTNCINYIDNENKIENDGLYCIPDGLNKYKIIKSITSEDGYIFSGKTYLEFQYSLEFVYYKMGVDYLKAVCKSIENKT